MDLYTISNFKSETCSSQNDKDYSKMRIIGSTNVILFKHGQIILNMELFIFEYAPAVRIGIEFAFNSYNRNTSTHCLVVLN